MDATIQWRVTCQNVTIHCLGVVVITPWPSDKIRPVGPSYTFVAVDTGGDLRRIVAHQVQRG